MNNQELIDNNQRLDQVAKRKDRDDVAAHESNDAAGGYPRSPGGANELAADRKMDDATGLSNTVNVQAPVDQRTRQAEQSNVGRRSDMTPD